MSNCYPDCGEWEDLPEGPNGQCTPRRLKQTCDAPTAYLNDTAESCTDTCPEGSITEPITVTIGVGEIPSPYSTDNANERAESEACRQAVALRAASPCLYPNEEQTCEDVCPNGTEGETITVTISAGDPRFNALSAEAANVAALEYACESVAELRAASPCIPGAIEPEDSQIFARSVESVADHVGCPGFDEPPDEPPQKYRIVQRTGELVINYWDSATCDGNIATDPLICEYNASRYWLVTGEGPFQTGGASCNGTQLGTGVPCDGGLFTSSCETQFTTENLVKTQTDAGATCCDPAGSGQPHYYTRSGVITVTLDDLDTEDDAIDRQLVIDGPIEDVPWIECSGTGCDSYTVKRTVLYSFNFKRSQIKIHADGLPANTSVTAIVNVWKQLLVPYTGEIDPGEPASLAEVQEYEATTDGSGSVDYVFELVPDVSYRYYVESYSFSL